MTQENPDYKHYKKMTLEELIKLKDDWLKLAEDHDWFRRIKIIVLTLGEDFHEELHYPYNTGRYIYKRYRVDNIQIVYSDTHEKVGSKSGETIHNETVTVRVDAKFPSEKNIVCRLHNEEFTCSDSIFVPRHWLLKISELEEKVKGTYREQDMAKQAFLRNELIEQLLLKIDV